VALLVLAGFAAVAACGGGSVTVGVSPSSNGVPSGNPTVIKMALTPDSVWQWLESSGTVAATEGTHNIRIEASKPFDQFAAFAGGHVDVVVINAMDVPQFLEQSDREPVIVGKLGYDRSFIGVHRSNRVETLGELVDGTIAVEGSLGSTLLWGLIAHDVYGLDLRVGSDDFALFIAEPASLAGLVSNGEVDACICLPDFSVEYLADGELVPLYGRQSGSAVYGWMWANEPDTKVIGDALVVDKQWLAANRDAVAALLELWDTGLHHWAADRAGVVTEWPALLSLDGQAQIDWMIDFLSTHDWMAHSVYLTETDAELHDQTFERMRRFGLLSESTPIPELDLAFAA